MCPVQPGVSPHLHHTPRREVNVHFATGRSTLGELHHHGRAERQRVQLVEGAVGVDVWRNPSAWSVLLQTHRVGRSVLSRWEKRDEPVWVLDPGRVVVEAEGLVAELVAVMVREATTAVRPFDLVGEDVDEFLLVLWHDEVLLQEDPRWRDRKLLHRRCVSE